MSTRSIDENEGITTGDLSSQLILDDTAQRVKTLSHVRFLAVQIIAAVIGKMKDRAHLKQFFQKGSTDGLVDPDAPHLCKQALCTVL